MGTFQPDTELQVIEVLWDSVINLSYKGVQWLTAKLPRYIGT